MSLNPQNRPSEPADDLSTNDTPAASSHGCCGLAALGRPMAALGMPLMMVVTMVAISAAAYFAGRSEANREQAQAAKWQLPPIHATASATSDKFSIATGSVSDDSEGFFVLDHNSGLLQCSVIYPRLGRFMAQFTGNVAVDLGTGGKGGQYIMVTGSADFPRSSNRPAGSSILYVLDTSTGNYACYGVPFDRVKQNANRQQQGTIVLLYKGTANPLIDRDNLR